MEMCNTCMCAHTDTYLHSNLHKGFRTLVLVCDPLCVFTCSVGANGAAAASVSSVLLRLFGFTSAIHFYSVFTPCLHRLLWLLTFTSVLHRVYILLTLFV